MAAPTHLRVEHLGEALGIDMQRPRLSWRLPQDSQVQVAYRLQAGDWDSGRVTSDQSVLVGYGGPPLRSCQRVEWRVKVWTDAGESTWSEPSWWEMGLLNPSDWIAHWIEPAHVDDDQGSSAPSPVRVFRHEFAADRPVTRARVYATAHGIYELYLNGTRVGDAELTPGCTTYRKNLLVQTFDVTGALAVGKNTLIAVLSEGWFRKQMGPSSTHPFGDGYALLVQLHVYYSSDSTMTQVATGPDWESSSGPVLAAGLNTGQISDLRAQAGSWRPVVVREYDFARLRASPAPPVRRVEELHPVRITRPSPDRQIVDLGQSINGWVRLSNPGPAGTTVILSHGDMLDVSGDVTTDHILMPPPDVDFSALGLPSQSEAELSARSATFQVDRVTAAGIHGESFEPRHTTHGFRYVRVTGHPEDLALNDVAGVVVHTDMRRTGWFECSNERLNALYEAGVWTFRGNACDIPTDCPDRERFGWMSWQVFAATAAFIYDVAGFSTKWLRDLAAEQLADGRVTHVAPMPMPQMWVPGALPGAAGWGDAAVIVPWEMYRAYGDKQLLAEQWPSMTAWVEYAARAARDHRHPVRAQARPVPGPHEKFLWDTGFHWGEWNEPWDDPYACFRPGFASRDQAIVATAFLHRSAYLLAKIGRRLGRNADAERYDEIAAGARAAWQAEFIGEDGSLAHGSQATYVRALAFALVPDDMRPQTVDRLVELIEGDDRHVGAGLLSTGYLLPVLADAGRTSLAYELLLQDTPPSWLTMIDRGATTIWEDWNSVDEDGVAHSTLNQFSLAVVNSFLHSYVAGIRPLDEGAGYRRFRVQPVPGGSIRWARSIHDCPYGRIESSWRITRDRFQLDLIVPPGTTAEVQLPDGRSDLAHPGSSSYECAPHIRSAKSSR